MISEEGDSSIHGRALIVAIESALEPLARALEALGWRVLVGARSAAAPGSAEVVIIHYPLLEGLWAQQMASGGWRPRPLWVVVGVPADRSAGLLQAGADLVVADAANADLLAAQIAAVARRARSERDRSPLTGLPGSRLLRQHITDSLAEEPLSLGLLDIDDFKSYNDARGHIAGNGVICALAQAIVELASDRPELFVSHIGGDDFCVAGPRRQIAAIVEQAPQAFVRRLRQTALPGAGNLSLTAVMTTIDHSTITRPHGLRSAFERLAQLKQRAREDD